MRSRAALRNALIELIEKEGYDNITVADLCESADLTRGTFYNHFKDKDALLHSLEADVEDGLCGFRDELANQNVAQVAWYSARRKPLPLLVNLFAYLRSQGDFLHAVLGPGGDVGFGPRLRDTVCTGIIMSVLHDKYRKNPTTFVKYYVRFFASAYLGIISRWVETGMQESDEEMALIAQRLQFIQPGESIEL